MTDYKLPTSAEELLDRYAKGERDFTGVQLEGAILAGANLSKADFYGAKLTGADLSGADLSRADLALANLARANLKGAEFNKTHLNEAYLKEANLNETYLSGANFKGADLRLANLRDAVLCFARFSEANLSGADLTDAQLEYAHLGGEDLYLPWGHEKSTPPLGLTQDQINSAKGNAHTVLPPGLIRPRSWITGRRDDDGEPRLILRLKGEAEPKTLQELTREFATWTEYCTGVAALQRSNPIIRVSRIETGSLVLELLADPKFLTAFGAFLFAAKVFLDDYKKNRKEQGEAFFENKAEKLLQEARVRIGKESEEDKELTKDLFDKYREIHGRGVEVVLDVPKVALTKNPKLAELVSLINAFDRERQENQEPIYPSLTTQAF